MGEFNHGDTEDTENGTLPLSPSPPHLHHPLTPSPPHPLTPSPPHPLTPSPPHPTRVLIVAPHPDDETIGAGGAAALHVRAGDEVTVVVVSDGRGSRALGLGPVEMVARRRAEMAAAMAALGVERWVWLGLPEGAWAAADAAAALRPFVERADLVYAPSCVDFHPEHFAVARVVAALLQPWQTVRIYELSVPLTPLLSNLVLDTRAVAAQKQRALDAFTTQQGAIRPLARLAAYRTLLYRRRACEPFWELSAPAYQRVIAAGQWTWETTPFRGLRPRPFSDPLAFLQGWQARVALREVGVRG